MITNLKIEEIANIFKRKWKLVLISILAVTLTSSVVTFFFIKPQYEVNTKLFIGKDETVSKVQSYDNNEVIMYQKLMKTYSEIIKTEDLARLAIEDANVDIKPRELLSNLTVVPVADTQMLEIKLKNRSPNEANKLLTSLTEKFIEISKKLVPNGSIKILEDVQVSNKPISPNKKINISIGVLIGLVVGIGVIVLLEVMDNTFKSKEQTEKELNMAVIGVIPNTNQG